LIIAIANGGTSPPRPQPRAVDPARVERVLAAIPAGRLRDRVLFGLIATTGLRASEALGAYVEDLELDRDSEHLTVTAKGGRRRTVLLDDPALLALLRRYLRTAGYTRGPLFRASKNSVGGPLRYATAEEAWTNYCATAGEKISLHQLRHTHATELVNAGVPVETIRKRLGHADIRSTLLYAHKTDQAADADIRAWRRRRISARATAQS
jgi:integrase